MKLILDDKKIRRGKPIGLPYQGSKKKISKKIIEIIKQNFGTDKPVYDVFGGGGAITAECILNGLEVHYNDLDNTITDMFTKVVSSDREYLKTLIVSRSEFIEIKTKENKSIDDELKLLINSFGNNRQGYLYSEKYSDLKHELVNEIIKQHDCFSGYKKTKTYNENPYKSIDKNDQLEHLQRLQQLERLQQLQQLQQIKQLGISYVTNESYEYFSEIKNSILYLDPPYQNSNGYINDKSRGLSKIKYNEIRAKLLKMPAGSVIKEDFFEFKLGESENNKNRMYLKDVINVFDSQRFYDWAFEMSKNNIVLISSYEISDNRFEEVYSFDKARSTLQGGVSNAKCEKIFMVKK